ncbi:lysophospholipid acyltransferase family protein [Nocardia higoensis]|uniref:lysophospholipid acyltransferase family protein n=1 Tax=Nocardia higoensis TaxID=228599 RepID=UPI0002FF9E5A|nr:lysophospholipid acyltransferase family protein [Nocardia higoensis]
MFDSVPFDSATFDTARTANSPIGTPADIAQFRAGGPAAAELPVAAERRADQPAVPAGANTVPHSWMPSSPCGPACIEPTDRVGTARVVARLAGLAALLMSYPPVHVLTPRAGRDRMRRGYAQAALRCLGMRLQVIDRRVPPKAPLSAGVLVVAGHVGWTDVVALAAVRPMGFVARADLVDWPVLGPLARLMKVIPIERERLRALPATVGRVAQRLSSGETVAVFPEGTTWCGRAYGSLRPAFFQAAVDAGAFVQPIRLRYLDRRGVRCTVPGFVGADSFLDSALRVLRSAGITAEIVLEPLEYPGLDRRELARRCERAVRGEDISRHGPASSEWIEATATRVQDPSPAPMTDRKTIELR